MGRANTLHTCTSRAWYYCDRPIYRVRCNSWFYAGAPCAFICCLLCKHCAALAQQDSTRYLELSFLLLLIQHIKHACGVAEVGAAVRHVQVHGAGAVVEGQDAVQRLGEVRQRRVGHRLAPARQPARAARGAGVGTAPRGIARKRAPVRVGSAGMPCTACRKRACGIRTL